MTKNQLLKTRKLINKFLGSLNKSKKLNKRKRKYSYRNRHNKLLKRKSVKNK